MAQDFEKLNIQWFPGHMTKAKRMMQENIKLIDLVIELVDRRAPLSSRNPDIDRLAAGKPRLIILNRVDLADPAVTAQWKKHFEAQGIKILETDAKTGKGINGFVPALRELLADKIADYAAKGQVSRPLRVMILGIPNVGKSTFINKVAKRKAAVAGDKPGVTRGKQWLALENGMQLLDTPGIHKAKNKLGDYMVNVAEHTLNDVDVILWLVEPTNFIGAGERHIIEQLKKTKTPVILVINKTDTVKKDDILAFIDTYRKELDFCEIVPVSALKGDNTDVLIQCILKYLPYGPAFYDEDTITDQPMRQIVAELIREKALRLLSEEIPHGIAVTVESMKERGSICDIEATIICERDSHKGIIIGKGGQMLKKIGSQARPEIEDMLEMKVNLQLWVKVKKDWRDSDILLKNFGYNPKDIEMGE